MPPLIFSFESDGPREDRRREGDFWLASAMARCLIVSHLTINNTGIVKERSSSESPKARATRLCFRRADCQVPFSSLSFRYFIGPTKPQSCGLLKQWMTTANKPSFQNSWRIPRITRLYTVTLLMCQAWLLTLKLKRRLIKTNVKCMK